MIHIAMTWEEIQILINLLENSITDIRGEVHETDNRDYRLMLQGREAIMKKILIDLQELAYHDELVV